MAHTVCHYELWEETLLQMSEINIEKMSFDDLEEVYEIDKVSFPIPWSKTSFEEELKNMLATYLVAKIDGRVVGYVGAWMVIDECHITNIAVHPNYRRKKIASKLINALLHFCNEHGISYILLEVRITNTPAQNFYKSFGFQSDGIRKGYYKNPDGTYDDAILMTKEI